MLLQVATPAEIEDAFQAVLDKLDDIALDCPDASEVLGKFLARAVVDEILAPAFLKSAHAEKPLAKEAIALATALASEKHRVDRLAHIWGPGDLTSVKRLKEETRLLLSEYLSTGDIQEADRCVRNLHAPSFHFQLVKEAVRLVLQTPGEEPKQRMLSLLSAFVQTALVSPDHIRKGFACVRDALDDIKLDVPDAAPQFEQLKRQAIECGLLSTAAAVAVAASSAASSAAATADSATEAVPTVQGSNGVGNP